MNTAPLSPKRSSWAGAGCTSRGRPARGDHLFVLRTKKLITLKDAIARLAREIPQSEHGMKQVQAAAHCVTEAAENNGPMQFARIGMLQAINRHHQHRAEPRRKATKKHRIVR
jgi:hypothetical protein